MQRKSHSPNNLGREKRVKGHLSAYRALLTFPAMKKKKRQQIQISDCQPLPGNRSPDNVVPIIKAVIIIVIV